MVKAGWDEGKQVKAEHLVYHNKEGAELEKLLAGGKH